MLKAFIAEFRSRSIKKKSLPVKTWLYPRFSLLARSNNFPAFFFRSSSVVANLLRRDLTKFLVGASRYTTMG